MKLSILSMVALTASAIMSLIIKTPPNLLQGMPLYVNPDSQVSDWIKNNKVSQPELAQKLQYIADQPQGTWLTGAPNDITRLSTLIASSTQEAKLPVIVLYNVPFRDCGSYSAGGAPEATAYKKWIDEIVATVNDSKAIIIIEPDALASMDCLPALGQSQRLDMIHYAAHILSENKNAFVYIDAGHPIWHSPEEMSLRLKNAGIEFVRGFSLNVSNFFTNQDLIDYGKKISGILNYEKTFVIDTSRNGNGPTPHYDWCNPTGRALGITPTTTPAIPFLDAYLWIKLPGESDGTCNGGPAAGAFWPDYASQLF